MNDFFKEISGIFGSSPRWFLSGNLINNNTHVDKINSK